MEIKKLGILTNPDDNYQNTWESQEVAVPLFDNSIFKFIVESNGEDLAEINNAVEVFLALQPEIKTTISPYIFQMYKEFVGSVEDDLEFTITSESDIWKYVTPINIIVRKRDEDSLIYVQILADCEWDMEHGIQIVFKNGNQLARVSEQDGHLTYADAFGLPDSEDRVYG